MAGGHKIEFPPLLAEGLHRMSLGDLKRLCVVGFPLSKRRESIMRALESLLAELSGVSIRAEVWINGSFLTKKIDPDDVDLVVVVQEQEQDLPTASAGKDVLVRIARQNFTNPIKCDSYLNVEYPPESPRYILGQKQRSYWLKQFGESRGGGKKGLAVLGVPII